MFLNRIQLTRKRDTFQDDAQALLGSPLLEVDPVHDALSAEKALHVFL
jgi:hypothetical protein